MVLEVGVGSVFGFFVKVRRVVFFFVLCEEEDVFFVVVGLMERYLYLVGE